MKRKPLLVALSITGVVALAACGSSSSSDENDAALNSSSGGNATVDTAAEKRALIKKRLREASNPGDLASKLPPPSAGAAAVPRAGTSVAVSGTVRGAPNGNGGVAIGLYRWNGSRWVKLSGRFATTNSSGNYTTSRIPTGYFYTAYGAKGYVGCVGFQGQILNYLGYSNSLRVTTTGQRFSTIRMQVVARHACDGSY